MNQKVMKTTKALLFCFIIALSSCEKDNLPIDNQTISQDPKILEANNWFEEFKSKENFDPIFKNLVYDWNKASIATLTDGSKAITVPIHELNQSPEYSNQKILYLYPLKKEKGFNTALFELIPKQNQSKQNVVDLNTFDGYIINWDLINGFVKGSKFDNSKAVFDIKLKVVSTNKTQDNSTGRAPAEPIELKEVIIGGSSGGNSYLIGSIFGNGSSFGGGGGGSAGNYTNGPHGGGGGGSTETASQIIEKKIDNTQLDPCPKGVLEKLIKATNCDIKNVFEKLGAEKGINVKMKSETPANGDTGQTTRTNPGVRYDYTIKITKDNISGTQLFKAHTILHELVHAFFMSLKDDYDTSASPAVYTEFPILFQAYVDKSYPGSKGTEHHSEMAKVYVNAIGSALQEFQTGVAVPYETIPDQAYTDMAWYGIRDIKAYSDLPEADRKRMENRYRAENNGSYYQGQSAIGKPCN